MSAVDQAAPERIWAKVHGASTDVMTGQRGLIGCWNEHRRDGQSEYIRADLAAPSAPAEGHRIAAKIREVAAQLSAKRMQGWANPLVSVLVDAANYLEPAQPKSVRGDAGVCGGG